MTKRHKSRAGSLAFVPSKRQKREMSRIYLLEGYKNGKINKIIGVLTITLFMLILGTTFTSAQIHKFATSCEVIIPSTGSCADVVTIDQVDNNISEVVGRGRRYMVLTASPVAAKEFCVNKSVAIYVNDTNTGRNLDRVHLVAIYNDVKVFVLETNRNGTATFTPNKVGIWNVTASLHRYHDTEIKVNVKSCVVTTTTLKPVVTTTTTLKPVVTTTTVIPVIPTTTVPQPPATTTLPSVTTTVPPAPAVQSWPIWLVVIIIIVVIIYLMVAKKGNPRKES